MSLLLRGAVCLPYEIISPIVDGHRFQLRTSLCVFKVQNEDFWSMTISAYKKSQIEFFYMWKHWINNMLTMLCCVCWCISVCSFKITNVCFQKIVDLIDLVTSECSDKGLMSSTYQLSTLTVVRESETPKYCVRLLNFTTRQSVGRLNF